MPETPPALPLETIFPVEYDVPDDDRANEELKNRGTLTIKPTGPEYVFTGFQRDVFDSRPVSRAFTAAQITDVTTDGRMIRFSSHAREKTGPFVFFCRDEAEARAVAALLPAASDPQITATREFLVRLDALAEARSPWSSVTNIIIALNVVVFVVMGALGAGWFQVDSMTPYVRYGANNGAATTDGEWWRLLTSMFMHYGFMHLALNMWALYQAGHFLEKLQGRWLYGLTYLASGLAGGFVSIGWHGDQTWSAGASGAIFGVYGAILGYLLREKQSLPAGIYQPMLKSTLTFAGYNILYGLRAGVDNSAHVGGVLGGLVFGWLLALPVDRESRERLAGKKFQLGLVVLAALIAAGVALTPRFDYRVAEVLAWDDANRGFGEQETDLLAQNEKFFARLTPRIDDDGYADWLEARLIPFYENWRGKLSALTLAPARSTARTRAALVRVFDLRLASYRHLVTGLRAHDSLAVAQYLGEEALVGRELGELGDSSKH